MFLLYFNIRQSLKDSRQKIWNKCKFIYRIMMKKQYISFFEQTIKWNDVILSAEHTAFSFHRVWATKMSGFRQWAWEMVSKRQRAPVNVRTSCMSANEGSKARLGVVQPRQSVLLPHQNRNWTATWSVLIVLLSQRSVTERVLACGSRDTMKVKAAPPNFMTFVYGSQVGGVTRVL